MAENRYNKRREEYESFDIEVPEMTRGQKVLCYIGVALLTVMMCISECPECGHIICRC